MEEQIKKIQENQDVRDQLIELRKEIKDEKIRYPQIAKAMIPIFIYIGFVLCISMLELNETVIAFVTSVGMIGLIINAGFQIGSIDSKIEKWKKEHPDEPACKFL